MSEPERDRRECIYSRTSPSTSSLQEYRIIGFTKSQNVYKKNTHNDKKSPKVFLRLSTIFIIIFPIIDSFPNANLL